MLSIIIPTFNEQKNVLTISHLISKALNTIPYEIIFVDDSTDNTPKYLAELQQKDTRIKFIHRTNNQGLATAVIEGFNLSHGDILAVMDSDLQHPPKILPKMLNEINSGADIVIPSRFLVSECDKGLNIIRKIISVSARFIGKILLKKLRPINDPMSGYFMFKRSVINDVPLNPVGWKIMIEILVKGHYNKVVQIPYKFQKRTVGNSKMSIKEQFNYILHLLKLVKYSPDDRRFYLFMFIGLSGFFVNMFMYYILVKFHIEVYVAGTISAFIAMFSNFFLNNSFTWIDRKPTNFFTTFIKYIITSLVGISINIAVLGMFYYIFSVNYILSNILGILLAVAWNYIINNSWTWKKTSKKITIKNLSNENC